MTFEPTQDANGDPTTCWTCGRHATGIGVGTFKPGRDGAVEPRWICQQCVPAIEYIRTAKRLDPYELRAIDHGVTAVGEYLDSIGKYDLADMDELEARMIVKAAWIGCGEGLRKELQEAPF